MYGINETEWKKPPSQQSKGGIQMETVLVSDLSKGNFKENREWKVESDGSANPSGEVETIHTGELPQSQPQESKPLLHRWKTTAINPRNMHVALAVILVMTLLVVVAMFLC